MSVYRQLGDSAENRVSDWRRLRCRRASILNASPELCEHGQHRALALLGRQGDKYRVSEAMPVETSWQPRSLPQSLRSEATSKKACAPHNLGYQYLPH